MGGDETVYLVSSFEDGKEVWKVIEQVYAEVFVRARGLLRRAESGVPIEATG